MTASIEPPSGNKMWKKTVFGRVLILILLACVVILIGLVYSLVDTIKLAKIQQLDDAIDKRVNHLVRPESSIYELRSKVDMALEFEMLQRSIYVFKNVCLESDKPQTFGYQLPGRTAYFNVTKKIVVYDHWGRSNRSLAVGGSSNSVFNRWDIQLVTEKIPSSYTVHDQTAFFVVQTCPGNLHHFWQDEFHDLFSVVYKMNRLSSDVTNKILYKLPWDLAPEDMGCFNTTRYENLLKTLYIDPVHDAFYRVPDRTCFKQAVFGAANLLPNDSRMAVDHVLTHFNIDRISCQTNSLTIVQRKTRRILNPSELLDAASEVGFDNIELVNLEDLSIREQLQTAACSRVFVGIQGAGLQWAIFMPENSTLIEISWPDKFWAGYFRQFVIQYGIRHFDLEAKYVRLNWPAYQDNVRHGKEVLFKERETLSKKPPKSAIDNIWKWADGMVDVAEYKSILTSVLYDLKAQHRTN